MTISWSQVGAPSDHRAELIEVGGGDPTGWIGSDWWIWILGIRKPLKNLVCNNSYCQPHSVSIRLFVVVQRLRCQFLL